MLSLRQIAAPLPTSRRWIVRIVLGVIVAALLAPAAIAAVGGGAAESSLQRGTVTSVADGSTVVSVQGFHFEGRGSEKKPARLVSVDDRGRTEWVYNGSERGAMWFYDVDPVPNDRLLVVSTRPGRTVVSAFDSESAERIWSEEFDIEDTHDVSRLSEDELVVANMRNWDEETATSNDRLFVYNRTTGEITWEWHFDEHYPEDTDGGHDEDWTHVNGVDVLDEHRLLVSPRNFDQAIVVNRTTDEIELQLGEDERHDVLHEQHNPDYLEAEDGTPTILVADSENDRVVEYALADDCEQPDRDPPGNAVDCEWELVWEVGANQLNWPRDADRLPNGNTLITDTLNHRVIEVTPAGEIVWEYYATWGPYDAERVVHGPGSSGPTMADLNVSGSHEVTGSAGLQPGTGDRVTFASWLTAEAVETPIEEQATWFATRWAHVTPWIRPVWMTGWDFLFLVLGAGVALLWAGGELVYQRRRIGRRVGNGIERLRGGT